MKLSMLLFTLCMVHPASMAFATTERPAEAAVPVLVASADPGVAAMYVDEVAVDAKPTSAGVAATLPDLPAAADANFAARAMVRDPMAEPQRVEASRFSDISTPLPAAPGVSLLQSSPLAGAARRLGAQRFNTEDGSSLNAFAVCYRLSKRSSVQVIPGDPAPVKLPITAMANNMGVTVGMVVRLSKAR